MLSGFLMEAADQHFPNVSVGQKQWFRAAGDLWLETTD